MTDCSKTIDWLKQQLPLRASDAHKGTCGRVGILAGSTQMAGAALLSARAAYRAGAGLVYLMSVPELSPILNSVLPEVIMLPLPSSNGGISEKSTSRILDYMQGYSMDSLAMGPGLGRTPEIRILLATLLPELSKQSQTLVIDADALNALTPDQLATFSPRRTILTPHPKEFHTFFGYPVTPAKRSALASQAAKRIRQIVVLKGPQTVIAAPERHLHNISGSPALATAGTGDVLTGMILALLGQGLPTFEAASLGAYLHGLSGDLAEQSLSTWSVMASDVIDYIPLAFRSLSGQTLSGPQP